MSPEGTDLIKHARSSSSKKGEAQEGRAEEAEKGCQKDRLEAERPARKKRSPKAKGENRRLRQKKRGPTEQKERSQKSRIARAEIGGGKKGGCTGKGKKKKNLALQALTGLKSGIANALQALRKRI